MLWVPARSQLPQPQQGPGEGSGWGLSPLGFPPRGGRQGAAAPGLSRGQWQERGWRPAAGPVPGLRCHGGGGRILPLPKSLDRAGPGAPGPGTEQGPVSPGAEWAGTEKVPVHQFPVPRRSRCIGSRYLPGPSRALPSGSRCCRCLPVPKPLPVPAARRARGGAGGAEREPRGGLDRAGPSRAGINRRRWGRTRGGAPGRRRRCPVP